MGFAERIERIIGEQIGRRLDVGERDEHSAGGNDVVMARGKLDHATPGSDANHVVGLDAEPVKRAARPETDD